MRSGDLVIFGCLQPQIKGYFCCSSSLHHLNPAYVKEEVCKSLLLPHSGIFGGGGENQTISLGTETRAQPVLPAHASASPRRRAAQLVHQLSARRTWKGGGKKKKPAREHKDLDVTGEKKSHSGNKINFLL